MSKSLLPLCSIGKIATRDGYVGATARLLLPFFGHWFANGNTMVFGNATLPQDNSRVIGGVSKPNTYQKAAGICLEGADGVIPQSLPI